jgi:hypothetical protein
VRYFWAPLFFTIFVLSCKENSFIDDSDFAYNYQPKELGHWVEYEVDSISYSDITSPVTVDSVRYYIRELLDTTFLDATGVENIRVERYKRYNPSNQWVLDEVGSFNISLESHQRYFRDLRFISLLFPVRVDKEWSGNVFLNVANEATLEYLDDSKYDWRSRYVFVDEPIQIDNVLLDSCLKVIQIDEENLFEKKYGEEQYARGIGLVSKELIILNTQAPPSGQTFLERAESGFILRYKLIDYKN